MKSKRAGHLVVGEFELLIRRRRHVIKPVETGSVSTRHLNHAINGVAMRLFAAEAGALPESIAQIQTDPLPVISARHLSL